MRHWSGQFHLYKTFLGETITNIGVFLVAYTENDNLKHLGNISIIKL